MVGKIFTLKETIKKGMKGFTPKCRAKCSACINGLVLLSYNAVGCAAIADCSKKTNYPSPLAGFREIIRSFYDQVENECKK
jgi:hypothetical protein